MMAPNTAEPRDRRGRILDGARSAFLRYGFERTNLSTIAANAGVSRTALYHYFPGKEDVFRAVVEELHATSLLLATSALEDRNTLEAALAGLLDAKFGRLLASISASPHAWELVDVTHRLTGTATRLADDAFQTLVVSALERHGRGKDASEVADTLIAAAKGLMRSGDTHVTKERFETRVKRLIRWVSS